MFPFYELRRAAWNLASGNVNPGEDVLIVASSDQPPELIDAIVARATLPVQVRQQRLS